MPSAIEFWALEAALQRIEVEALSAVIARHQQAARATRLGLSALRLSLWVEEEGEASTLATTVVVPEGVDAAVAIAKAASLGGVLSPSHGNLGGRLLRLDHTGARAAFGPVLSNVTALGLALKNLGVEVDLGAAAAAAAEVYANTLR
jgi:aspartate aminotransferase-like enzyme